MITDSWSKRAQNLRHSKTSFLLASALFCSMGMGLAVVSTEAAARNPAPPSLKAGAPDVYVVKKGDTLWDIAGRFLKSPWRWKEVWVANPHIRNPHWIYPGDKILLCVYRGRTLIGIDDGTGCAGVISRATNTRRTRGQVRVESTGGAIPTIPLGAIRSFLTQATVVELSDISNAPYVLAAQDRHVITAKGETIYVRGRGLTVGNTYGIFRPGEQLVNPDNGASLGYEARLVALGRVTDVNGDIYTVDLTRNYGQEVRENDRILPSADVDEFPPLFQPLSRPVKPGRLIKVMDGVSTAAVNSVIAINRGSSDGVQEGQVFVIYKRGALIRDPYKLDVVRLPSDRAGTAMAFRTFKGVSYALILDAETGVRVGDELISPNSID